MINELNPSLTYNTEALFSNKALSSTILTPKNNPTILFNNFLSTIYSALHKV